MSARLEGLLGAVDRLIREPGAEARIRDDGRGFLADGGLAEADAIATAAIGAARLLLYRKLIRRGIAAAVRQQMPRSAARLGETFTALVDAFVEAAPPRSHYLRDVSFAFLDFAAPRIGGDATLAPYLADLARHELSAFAIGSAPDAEPEPRAEIELDRGVVFDPSVRLARYEHAVHELSDDVEARDVPRAGTTWLLGYRDVEDEVRYLALSAVAAAVVTRLLEGRTLREATVLAAEAEGCPLDDALLASTAQVLTDLEARGALRGGRTGGKA